MLNYGVEIHSMVACVQRAARRSSSCFDAINVRSSMRAAKHDEAGSMIYNDRASSFWVLADAAYII